MIREEIQLQEITPDFYLASLDDKVIGIGTGHPSRWMREVIEAIKGKKIWLEQDKA
jgi:hypothetical protein